MACASPTQATQPMTTQTTTAAPKFGTMIPSRIFVGGIDFKVCNTIKCNTFESHSFECCTVVCL